MKATVNIPAYHASGIDYPSRQVDLNFPGFPLERLQINVMGENGPGNWEHGIVEIVNVRADPGWKLPSNKPSEDGYWYVEVFTSWVQRPNGKVSRGR